MYFSSRTSSSADSRNRLRQQLEVRSRRRSGLRERVRYKIFFPILSYHIKKWTYNLTIALLKVKDKANHAVILDKATSDKLYKDVQSYRLITVATLVDRLKINGSLARKALNDLEEKGQIKKIVGHSKLSIYSESHIYSSSTFTTLVLIVLQHERLQPQSR